MTPPEDHALVEACYSMAAWSGKHEPYMKCSCGFTAHEETWQDVGIDMDNHLWDVLNKQERLARGEEA